MTGSHLQQIGKPLLLPALGLLFRLVYVWQLIISESDKKMMLQEQENPQRPFEVLFQFTDMAGTDNEGETLSEIFWAESASDAINTALAGNTFNNIRIVEVKEK